MKLSNKKPAWKDVKAILLKKENSELLKLIADLYLLNTENKSFIHSRYSISEKTLEPYKSIISESLYPDERKNNPIRLSVGKKAIADYFKATKDKGGQLELMVHYLETGNRFTLDYGDINENFYRSLTLMFEKILVALKVQSIDVQKKYLLRLEEVVSSARHIGWRYHDDMNIILSKYKKSQGIRQTN